jgi:hypothetical protein
MLSFRLAGMKRYIIPVIIFLCFAGIYVGISIHKDNNFLFLPVWDVAHYVSISESGYQVYPCTPGMEYPAGKICGNAGWYPFWPIVAKIIRPLLGGSSQTTFIGLAFLFTLLGFIILFLFMEKHYGYKEAIFTLLAIAFGPASFYLLTGFPYALFIFLFASYLFLFYKPPEIKRDILLFILGLAISLTYPSGILFVIIPALVSLFSHGPGNIPNNVYSWKRRLIHSFPFILGLLIIWGYFYFKFDDFFLQIHFQEKYHRTWAIPLYIIFKSLTEFPIYSPENLAIIWYGLTFLLFIPYRIRPELWILAIVLYLFSPTTGTTMSIYRHYLILFPSYMIIGTSSRPIWIKIAFIALGFLMALFVFFPLFISNRLI